MKLIIDISNELAEKGHWYNDEELWTVIKAAQNGTPIDDDSLLAALMLFAMDNVTPQSKAQIKEKLLQILDRKENRMATKQEMDNLITALSDECERLQRDYLLQSCVEALKVLQAENDALKIGKIDNQPTVDVLEQIKDEIESQHKWLMQTNHTLCDIDIAFDAINSFIAKHTRGEE